jgi:hypothetical protein
MGRARFRVFRHTSHAKVLSVTRPIRSIAVFLVQVIRVGGRYEHHESEPHEDVELFLVALECVEAQFCRMAATCCFAPP